jgi:hypothetical protein
MTHAAVSNRAPRGCLHTAVLARAILADSRTSGVRGTACAAGRSSLQQRACVINLPAATPATP